MKRKIQLKKKTTYDFGNNNINRKFYLYWYPIFTHFFQENYLLSYSLFYKNFLNKNFSFYNIFIKSLIINKKLFLYKNKFRFFRNALVINPVFFFKKQFFGKNIEFFRFLIENNLNGYFVYNNFFKLNYLFNNKNNFKSFLISYNFFILNINYDFIKNFYFNLNKEALNMDDFFLVKNLIEFSAASPLSSVFFQLPESLNPNFIVLMNLNFNIFLLNICEFYKIFQILFLYSLFKN